MMYLYQHVIILDIDTEIEENAKNDAIKCITVFRKKFRIYIIENMKLKIIQYYLVTQMYDVYLHKNVLCTRY